MWLKKLHNTVILTFIFWCLVILHTWYACFSLTYILCEESTQGLCPFYCFVYLLQIWSSLLIIIFIFSDTMSPVYSFLLGALEKLKSWIMIKLNVLVFIVCASKSQSYTLMLNFRTLTFLIMLISVIHLKLTFVHRVMWAPRMFHLLYWKDFPFPIIFIDVFILIKSQYI